MKLVERRQVQGMEEVFGDKREMVLRVASRHGAGNVRVFGSVARGAATDESDVDLLVDVIGPTTPWFPASLKLDLEALLDRKVDVVTERGIAPLLRKRILKESIPLQSTNTAEVKFMLLEKDPRFPIAQILEAIRKVRKYTQEGERAFASSELIQDAVIRNFQIMGEAARRIPKAYQARHPAVPWGKVIALRNVLVHEYDGVDYPRLWRVIREDLPALEEALSGLIPPIDQLQREIAGEISPDE